MSSDTIYAFASGAGRAALGVFRLSGPKTRSIVEALTGTLPPPRHARLTRFRDPVTKDFLDRGLVLWFPAPASFTGEDCAEFHIHGGAAVQAAMVQAFGSIAGLRLAGPGEFTRVAFLNGKLDLSAVEGLADLIDAETQAQRRQALRQVSGVLREQALVWRASLLEASALLEGEIDFSDEADVPKQTLTRVIALLDPIITRLEKELGSHTGERIRDGVTILIAGPPNAGKSTLLNALARRDVAIVSEFAGTTRDLLEVHLDIHGVPVTLIDTAGLRESADPIEQIGMSRARARAKNADLVLWLNEKGAPVAPDPGLAGQELWVVSTKSDLRSSQLADDKALSVSAATGENLDRLIDRIAAFARSGTFAGEAGLVTRARHRQAFQSAAEALRRIVEDGLRPIEFLAEDLRLAARALESLVGGVDVEDILGEIFSRFCVGK
jgi:tRNA modification GTPase